MRHYSERQPNDRNSKAEAIRRRREMVMREDEEEDYEPVKQPIQAKLEVSQPGDAQEREADNIARKVVDGGDANISQLSPASNSVQSKSEGDTLHAPEGLQRQLDSSKGSGQSLPENVQQDIGGKMGADLGDVKIHTGSNAHEMADSVNAKAFTHGQDIYFKDGNYDPGSKGGKELLAHELVHTQQQGNGVGRKVWRQTESINSVTAKHEKGELDDYTGLSMAVVDGTVIAYKNKSGAAKAEKGFNKDDSFTIGSKVGERYVVYRDYIDGFGQFNTLQPDGFVDIDFSLARLRITKITQLRWISQAQQSIGQGNIDLSLYTIRVTRGKLKSFTDEQLTQKSEEKLIADDRFFVNKKISGGYKINRFRKKKQSGAESKQKKAELNIEDFDQLALFIRDEDLASIKYEIVSVSAQRKLAEAAAEGLPLHDDLSGYQVEVIDPGMFTLHPYPSLQVTYNSFDAPKGTRIDFVEDQEGFSVVLPSAFPAYFYLHSIFRAFRSAYKITKVPFDAPAEIVAERSEESIGIIQLAELEENIRKSKNATVDYSRIQQVLQGVDETPDDNEKTTNFLNQLTEAEMGVLRAQHRKMLIEAGLNVEAWKSVIDLVKTSAGQDASIFLGLIRTGTDDDLYHKLYEAFDSKDEQKELASALEGIIGADEDRIAELKRIIAEDEVSEIDVYAATLTESDMHALDMATRISALQMMVREATGWFTVSDEEDDQTIIRLIRTTPEGSERETLLKPVIFSHPDYKSNSDNIYDELIDFLDGEALEEFYSLLAEFFAEVDLEKMKKFHDALSDNDSFFRSDTAIELAQNMSVQEMALLDATHRTTLLRIMLTEESAVDPDEEALIAIILDTLPESGYAEMNEFLELAEFFYLRKIIDKCDTPPHSEDVKAALNPIMADSEALTTKTLNLLEQGDQDAEDFIFLLNDSAMGKIALDKRKELILLLAGGAWTDGVDEASIIRLTATTPADEQAALKEWYNENVTLGWFALLRRDQILSAIGGANRPLFLTAIGQLGGENTMAESEQRMAFADEFDTLSSDEKVRRLSMLTDEEMGSLMEWHREKYLNAVAFDVGSVNDIGESIIIRLLRTTPDDQVDLLLKDITKDSGKLYNQLHYRVDQENFNTMQAILQQLAFKNQLTLMGAEQFGAETEKLRQEGMLNGAVIPWGAMGTKDHKVKFDGDKIKLTFTFRDVSDKTVNDFLGTHPQFELTKSSKTSDIFGNSSKYDYVEGSFDPTQMVGVIFSEKKSEQEGVKNTYEGNLGDRGGWTDYPLSSGGAVNIMPAIGLFELEVEDERAALQEALIVLNVILLAVGIGEIMLAANAVRLAFAIVDVALNATMLVITPFRKELMKTEAGRLFLGIFDGVMIAYGVVGLARLGYALYEVGVYGQLVKQWNKVKPLLNDTEMVAAIESALRKIGKPDLLYKKIFRIKDQTSYDDALREINGFKGLTEAERQALRDMARMKFKSKLSGKKFLDDLEGKSTAGKIVDNKVDGLYIGSVVKNEDKALKMYQQAGYGDLTDVEFIRTYRRLDKTNPGKIYPLLSGTAPNTRGAVMHDIVRLERALNRVNGNIDRLTGFIVRLSGNNAKFQKLVDHMPFFSQQPVLGIKPRYFAQPGRHFQELAIPHVYDKHVMECFDFNNPEYLAGDVDFFPPYTTQQDVADYIDESLDWLGKTKGSQYPINDFPEYVILKNGITVRIGSSVNARGYVGSNTIGMFYPPKSGGFNLVNFSGDELLAYKFLFLGK